jgi:ribulose 1,5-bisphosphate carboxylase large subunit-like protein
VATGPSGELDPERFVVATYRLRPAPGADVRRIATELAELQSTGTWVALARETDALRERHGARVVSVREADVDRDAATEDQRDWLVQIAYPVENVGGQIPLLLATVFGEGASTGEIRLVDLDLPPAFTRSFGGPGLGIAGLRERLGVHHRPLLIVMMKPAIGLSPAESEEVFRELARGGADAVKDDELLVSPPTSDLVERVRAHARASRAVFEDTGQRTIHFANVTDRPDRMLDHARRAVDAGATGLMIDYLTVGISALSMLADDPAIVVPVLAHLAFSGALTAAPRTGVSPHLVLGVLPRLAGADVVVYPSPYGTLTFWRDDHLRIGYALRAPVAGIAPTLPAPGGGLHAGLVPRLVADLGPDHALGVGGAVHAHPMGPAAGARAVRQAIDASVGGEPLSEAAARHPELAAALQAWPEPASTAGAAHPGVVEV